MDAALRSSLPPTVCGVRFHPRALRIIRETIVEYHHTSRAEIARQVCARLGWRDQQGRLKQSSAVAVLLDFAEKEWIQLPPPRGSGGGSYRPAQLCDESLPAISGSLASLGDIELNRVATRQDADLWNSLVAQYHYLGYARLFGAQIRYLASCSSGVLGALSFSAAAITLGDRDRWIGWNPEQRRINRHLVVNNSRFLIQPKARIPNLASHLLARVIRRLPGDFRDRYGYSPVLLESFVEKARFTGTSYKAANWICVGQTTGRGRNDLRSHRQIRQQPALLPIKSIWLYPLRPDARQRLCEAA